MIRGLKRKNDSKEAESVISHNLPVTFDAHDIFPWLPAAMNTESKILNNQDNKTSHNQSGRVLLFYKYR